MKYGQTQCKVEGCDKPRWEGTKLVMCEEHAREYNAAKNRRAHERRKLRQRGIHVGKPGRPRKQVQAVPTVVRPALQSVKFLLVDNVTGEVLRVSGVVEQRVPMADLRSGALHEETEQLFMRKGYAVGERNRAS